MPTIPPLQPPQGYDYYAEKVFDNGERRGNVVYPDGRAFARPLQIPRSGRVVLTVICAAALAIGSVSAYRYYDSVVNKSAYDAEDVQTELSRGVSVDVPVLTSYAGLDSATILAQLTESGYTVIDLAQLTGSTSRAIDLVKLPSDMSEAEAALALAQGVDNLSSSDAAKLLSGSWRMTQTNATGVNLIVRYADFDSGSTEAAIETAIASQGWDASTASEMQTDSNNNTSRSGAVEVNGTDYTWTVSVCPLSEVYTFSGEPENSYYVGIHLEG